MARGTIWLGFDYQTTCFCQVDVRQTFIPLERRDDQLGGRTAHAMRCRTRRERAYKPAGAQDSRPPAGRPVRFRRKVIRAFGTDSTCNLKKEKKRRDSNSIQMMGVDATAGPRQGKRSFGLPLTISTGPRHSENKARTWQVVQLNCYQSSPPKRRVDQRRCLIFVTWDIDLAQNAVLIREAASLDAARGSVTESFLPSLIYVFGSFWILQLHYIYEFASTNLSLFSSTSEMCT